MRNTDPLDFFANHRETILRWGGISAAALVVFLILRFFAMRMGGWKAATRRLWREIALTAYAFAGPVRAWLRYRRSVRVLVRGLGAGATWRDAERALVAAKFAAAPAQPYAAVVGEDTVTVLFAAAGMPSPRGVWRPVPDDPWSWTAVRAELPSVTPDADGARPIVVTLGERDRECVFLDLVVGPAMVCVQGDPRSGPALFQAVAAQLDARLPSGQVVVADGVHRDVAGQPVREAYRTARGRPPRLGLPVFLVTPELPDPLPPELTEPPGDELPLRLLLGGPGRGHIRTLLTDRHGRVGLPGTPLLVVCHALGAALARVLPTVPPVLPPVPAPVARSGADHATWFAEEESGAETPVAQPRTAAPAAVTEPVESMASAVSARSSTAEPASARPAHESTAAGTFRAPAPTTPTGSPAVSARREATPRREPAGTSGRPPITEPPTGRDPAPIIEPTHRPDPSPPTEPTHGPDASPPAEPTHRLDASPPDEPTPGPDASPPDEPTPDGPDPATDTPTDQTPDPAREPFPPGSRA
ncbi:hypothetical protein [Embleya hyalina]|uniref:Uncharacterized protein n=1 Tax=Embleya hyalina TaxID=516124 RepID=A0A401YDK3_9ACTN|nr:hypothetical protein [Embleya hyalina]GCD92684.1 hypothetical protein EHYA_00323 [Embleya hyalina]